MNLIVWNDLAERQRRELLSARLLAVSGEVQKQGRVVHVLAGSSRI
jgi:error-prone DNA polymerase